jgi:hypothetical protein
MKLVAHDMHVCEMHAYKMSVRKARRERHFHKRCAARERQVEGVNRTILGRKRS